MLICNLIANSVGILEILNNQVIKLLTMLGLLNPTQLEALKETNTVFASLVMMVTFTVILIGLLTIKLPQWANAFKAATEQASMLANPGKAAPNHDLGKLVQEALWRAARRMEFEKLKENHNIPGKILALPLLAKAHRSETVRKIRQNMPETGQEEKGLQHWLKKAEAEKNGKFTASIWETQVWQEFEKGKPPETITKGISEYLKDKIKWELNDEACAKIAGYWIDQTRFLLKGNTRALIAFEQSLNTQINTKIETTGQTVETIEEHQQTAYGPPGLMSAAKWLEEKDNMDAQKTEYLESTTHKKLKSRLIQALAGKNTASTGKQTPHLIILHGKPGSGTSRETREAVRALFCKERLDVAQLQETSAWPEQNMQAWSPERKTLLIYDKSNVPEKTRRMTMLPHWKNVVVIQIQSTRKEEPATIRHTCETDDITTANRRLEARLRAKGSDPSIIGKHICINQHLLGLTKNGEWHRTDCLAEALIQKNKKMMARTPPGKIQPAKILADSKLAAETLADTSKKDPSIKAQMLERLAAKMLGTKTEKGTWGLELEKRYPPHEHPFAREQYRALVKITLEIFSCRTSDANPSMPKTAIYQKLKDMDAPEPSAIIETLENLFIEETIQSEQSEHLVSPFTKDEEKALKNYADKIQKFS
jgi:hypothetical protein